MTVDDLLDRLASLSINAGKGFIGKNADDNEGEHTVQELRSHLAAVRHGVLKAGSSVAELKKRAKQDARGLLKIAQAGLKNETGSSEPLRLTCEAVQVVLPLAAYAGAAELAMEKLCYQAIARCVDLGDFVLGLRAAALLQTCLRQREGGMPGAVVSTVISASGNVVGDPHVEPFLALRGENGGEMLRLSSFEQPSAKDSLDVAKLVSGASLNTCRCCLEVGSKEALVLTVEELGRSASAWIDSVGQLGERAKAEAYRDHLFKLLWRVCSALEKPNLGAQARQCLTGRQTALEILARQENAWSAEDFVAHAHRAALSLERRDGESGKPASFGEAAELSIFCLRVLGNREGKCWPAREESRGEGGAEFQPAWVDWLQYAAGLQDKFGDDSEAQRLLQLAYEYVRRCSKQGMGGKQKLDRSIGIMCAAYAGVLKFHAAATTTAHCSLLPANASHDIDVNDIHVKRQPAKAKPGLGKRAGDGLGPTTVVHACICRGLEYLETVGDSLQTIALAEEQTKRTVGMGSDPGVFVAAVVKALKWTQKACSIMAIWVDKVKAVDAADRGELGLAEWSALNGRGLQALGDLSRNLADFRKRARRDVQAKIPSVGTLVELGFDSYLRAAYSHLNALSSVTQVVPTANAGKHSSVGGSYEDGARQALTVAERMCNSEGDVLTSQHTRRTGVGWFGLGQALLESGKVAMGLDALVQGCRLLESWVENARCGGVGADHSAILRSAQLDLRLSKLSKVLLELGEYAVAAAAVAKALSFCPELWAVSDGRLESAANAQALVERYVACRLRVTGTPQVSEVHDCLSDASPRPPEAARDPGAAVAMTMNYLMDGEGLPVATGGKFVCQGLERGLLRRRLPAAAVAWVLLAECRTYRMHLPLHVPENIDHTAGERTDTLVACVEGHRRATEAVLKVCTGITKAEVVHPEHWEARAHVLSAWFEHDIFLVNVGARKGLVASESVASSATIMADLHTGIRHAIEGSETAVGDRHGQTPTSAAVAGVCACIRAMLMRDLAEPGDGVKDAMQNGLDLLGDAVTSYAESSKATRTTTIESADASEIVSCLEVLEAHYTLHRDTQRMVKSAELRVVLSGSQKAREGPMDPPAIAATVVDALSAIGVAYHSAGIPKLVHIFSAAAGDRLCELTGAGEVERQEAGISKGGRDASAFVDVEAARISADTLRGLCLAGRKGGTIEAERTLLEARRAVLEDGKVEASETAAFLECVAGLGLSWLYERCGRLAEAVGELRHVLRLCHAWASCGGPWSESDRQVISLSAPKGASLHDDQPGTQAAQGGFGQPEEGVGEDSREVEESIGRRQGGVALSSRWIPVYLEGLARMGRLWRARGFASKASGYLRQGCVVSEPLRAARLLRSCLREEVEVAVQAHQFDRADRLLSACQTLLEQEQLDQTISGEKIFVSGCATCKTLFALKPGQTEPGLPPTNKGKGLKKGPKRGAGKAKAKATSSLTAASSVAGLCVRCREFSLSAAELLVTESDVLRRQGDFIGAISACERGQKTLAPLVKAASRGVRVDSSLAFEHAALVGGVGEGEEGNCDLGWRTLELLSMLRLHQGRASYLLGDSAAAKDLLMTCAKSDGAPVLVRATALYRLGRMYLDAGDAPRARAPLNKAEVLTRGVGAPKLVRRVRRALAILLAWPEDGGGERRAVGVDGSWRVAALSSLSVGVTYCNHVAHKAARQKARKGKGSVESVGVSAGVRLFEVVSGRSVAEHEGASDKRVQREDHVDGGGGAYLSEAVGSELRAEWPIISLCLAAGKSDTKHLLLTRLVRGRPPLTASVLLSAQDTQLLERWRRIMEENRDTLRGHSAEEATTWGNKEKAAWWDRRAAVDEAVGSLLNELEHRWLTVHGLAPILMGKVVGNDINAALEDVCNFAQERITRARRVSNGGARGKGATKGKAGGRARVSAKNAATAPEVADTRASGAAELVRVCIRGGDAMSKNGWLRVVRRTLLDVPGSEVAAQEISAQIQERVQAAFFARAGVVEAGESGSDVDHDAPSTKATAAAACSKDNQCCSLEIEAGRSTRDSEGKGKAQTAQLKTAQIGSSNHPGLDEASLSKMKVAELRAELSARGIAVTGLKLKNDLLTRLTAAVRQEANGTVSAGGRKTSIRNTGVARRVGDKRQHTTPSSRAPVQLVKSGAKATAINARRHAVNISANLKSDRTDGAGSDGLDGCGNSGGGGSGAERHPVVLVLDEELQAMPWEALPCLRGHAVTRVPAVPFVFSALATRWDQGEDSHESASADDSGEFGEEREWMPSRDGIRINRGFYVLDPEANLSHTQKQLWPIFDGLRGRLGWSGTRGEAPSEEAMAKALQEVDIFAYCGHGAGEMLVGREAVAGLMRCAVVVLMGCSSGRLKGYGDFEPSGMASSYLVGGSPAVVANLWDVTDRDIDRFSVALLDSFVGANEKTGIDAGRQAATLAHSVAKARLECKMAFIIGHAPVCYGIPVAVADATP